MDGSFRFSGICAVLHIDRYDDYYGVRGRHGVHIWKLLGAVMLLRLQARRRPPCARIQGRRLSRRIFLFNTEWGSVENISYFHIILHLTI